MPCNHATLTYESSSHAETAGFPKRTRKQLCTAAGEEVSLARPPNIARVSRGEHERQKRTDRNRPPPSYDTTFPAPLVLPGDELAWDPKCPPQSYRSWLNGRWRNQIERHEGGRNVVYVVVPPAVEGDLEESMRDWATFRMPGKRGRASAASGERAAHPKMEDVVRYLAAFYHGVPVKMLPRSEVALTFAKWEDDEAQSSRQQKRAKLGLRAKASGSAAKKIPPAVALRTSKEAIRIRVRERRKDIYNAQLNLNDLLDVAIEILPNDAYALLILVEQDLYEDEDDDFACGRAYGGSRVAVVSMARYHPEADEIQGVDREHAWPVSHCKAFVDRTVNGAVKGSGQSLGDPITLSSSPIHEAPDDDGFGIPTALENAVMYHRRAFERSADQQPPLDNTNIWLGRVCRTASHELGHCFGIGHCVYYACVMQGTASIIEDARQPLYLCPIDLAKVRHATGADTYERYQELYKYCSGFAGAGFFEPLKGWLTSRMAQVAGEQVGTVVVPQGSDRKTA